MMPPRSFSRPTTLSVKCLSRPAAKAQPGGKANNSHATGKEVIQSLKITGLAIPPVQNEKRWPCKLYRATLVISGFLQYVSLRFQL